MANHKSAKKRIKTNAKRRLANRYVHKTTRNAIRDLRSETDAAKAVEALPKVVSMIDRLAKKNIIHKKKADNLKSSLTKLVSAL